MQFKWLTSYEQHFRPFRAPEAWTLYKLAAFGEAVGWSLLLLGIALKRYVLHGNNIPVLIAGQLHGMLFLMYIAGCVLLYPSLGWRRGAALLAGLASVPPYGSLLSEQYFSHRRQLARARLQQRLVLYSRLSCLTIKP